MTADERKRRAAYNRAYYQRNRERCIARTRANDEKHPELRHARELKKLYGMTLEDFQRLWTAQNGRCALCDEPLHPPRSFRRTAGFAQRTCVDHDHSTGRVRGLLHAACNTNLAGYEALLKNPRVATYLAAIKE